MMIAGVDLGKNKAALSRFTNTGALIDVSYLELDTHLRRATNLHELAEWVRFQVDSRAVLYIEEPLVGRNTRVSLELAQTAGAVMAACYRCHITLVPVGSWKSSIVNAGNASKEQVAAWLKTNHPDWYEKCIGNQDRIDATCIGLYGVRVEQRATKLADVRQLHPKS